MLSAKEANSLVVNTFEQGYIQNKIACDNALIFADDRIRSAASKMQFYAYLPYSFSEGKMGNWNGWYYDNSCPNNLIRYLIIKKGYTVQTEQGKTDNCPVSPRYGCKLF